MKGIWIGLIALGGVVFIALMVGLGVMGSYNGMVADREAVDTQWAEVQTQYQRRFDLIPNLVGAVKGYLAQEQAVFGAIAEARTHYANAKTTDEKVQAGNQVEGALARLLVVMENYPQLKSDVTVRGLTDELAGTENRIQISRQRYNEKVRGYNVSIKSFPRSILAGMFGFEPKTLFEADKEASAAPKVDLQLNNK